MADELDERKLLAKKWVDSLGGSAAGAPFNHWRLSLISKRFVEGKERPVRIRRFAEGCPPSCVKEAIDYLVSQAPYVDVIYNGQKLDGAYRPTLTYWKRDSQEMVNGIARSDATYTIIQDLIEKDLEDTESAVTQLACSQEETTEWHWDEATIGEIPETGSRQGYTYALTNVYRGEDGAFNWQLVTRKALTQHLPETKVACNSLGAEITTETWDNVYGDVDSPTDDTGTPIIGLPPPCDSVQGTATRMTVTENPDCTFKYVIEKSTSAEDGFTWSDGTVCRTRTNFVYENVRTERPESLIPAPTPGVQVSSSVKRNADLSWNVEFSVTEAPAGSFETWVQGSKCRPVLVQNHHNIRTLTEAQSLVGDITSLPDGVSRTARINRNEDCSYDVSIEEIQPTQAGEAFWEQGALHRKQLVYLYQNVAGKPSIPTPTTGVSVDANLRKNDDCTWSGTITLTYAVDGQLTEYGARETMFERVTEERHYGVPEATKSSVGKTASAGGGTLVERKEDRNPDGTVDVVSSQTTEKPVAGAQKTKRKTLRGVTTTTVSRNVTDGSTVVTNVGDEVRVETTPGGLFNRTVVSVEKEPVGVVGADCQTTVFEHSHQTTENVTDKPSEEASTAGSGKTYRKTARQTEEGTWDVTEQTTTEVAVPSAQVIKRKTLRGITTTTVDRNTSVSTTDVSKIGDEVRVEKTPGGLYNRSVTSLSPESVGTIGTDCQTTVFEHTHQTTENKASKPDAEAGSAGSGVTRRKSARQTEEGSWDVTTQTTTEKHVASAQVTKRKTLRGVVTTTVDRNTTASSTNVSKVGDEVRVEKTPGGLYNRSVTSLSPESVGTIGTDCQTTVFEHTHQTVSNEASKPSDEASSAGGGKTYRKSSRQTEEGSWDVTTQTTEELVSPSAQVTKRKTLRGVVTTTVDRNTSNSDTTVGRVGDEVRVERTPGGLYNRTKTSISVEDAGTIGTDCQTTVFEHTHQTVTNQSGKPAEEASAAGGGKTYRKSARQTEEGTWDVTTQTTDEKAVPRAQVTKRKTLRGVITTTVDRNVSNSDTSVSNVGDEVHVEQTPGGRYNRSSTSVSKTPVGKIGSGHLKQKNVVRTTNMMNQTTEASEPGSPAVNVEVSTTSRMNDVGTWDVETQTTTFSPATGKATTTWATETTETTVIHHNTELTVSGGEFTESSITPDDRGAANTTLVKYSPKEVDSGWITWDSKRKEIKTTYYYHNGIRVFKNLTKVPTASSAHNCSYAVSINKFGRFDGQITYSDLYDWKSDDSSGGMGYESFSTNFYDREASGKIVKLATLQGKSFLLTNQNAKESFRNEIVDAMRSKSGQTRGLGLGLPKPMVIGDVGIVFTGVNWEKGREPKV